MACQSSEQDLDFHCTRSRCLAAPDELNRYLHDLRSHIQQDIREAHEHLLREWHAQAQSALLQNPLKQESLIVLSASSNNICSAHKDEEDIPPSETAESGRPVHEEINQGHETPRKVKRSSSIVGRLNNQTSFIPPTRTKSDSSVRSSYLQHAVDKPFFQAFFAGLIVLNAVTIGLQTDHMAQQITEVVPPIYILLDRIFCLTFTIELSLRFLAYGRRFFSETGLLWGIFDCCVVGLQVSEELLQVIAPLTAGEGSTGAGNMSFMRVMRILRLVRVLRIIRIIRFMDKLRMLVASIMSSMRSLIWTLMLLVLGIYVVGIYFTQLVLDFRFSRSAESIHVVEKLAPYFGRLSPSMLTLYQAMSGGINWYDLSSPLLEISTLQGLVFVLYTAFTVLALTNVVTGVFVEGALKSAKQEEEDVMLDTLRRMFWENEVDGECSQSRYLGKEEFKQRLDNPALSTYLQSISVDPTEASLLFTLIDNDDSGMIDYEEWLCGCMRIRGAARAIDTILLHHEIVEARRELDTHHRWLQEHLILCRP